jgi:methyl coenzyme M reductase gamma subunit
VLALAGMANAPATPSSRAEMAMTRFKGVTSVRTSGPGLTRHSEQRDCYKFLAPIVEA